MILQASGCALHSTRASSGADQAPLGISAAAASCPKKSHSNPQVGETFSDAMRNFYGPGSWSAFTRSVTFGTGSMADKSDTFRITCGALPRDPPACSTLTPARLAL